MASDVMEAASVLLARGRGSQEVLLVRRADNLRFMGGFHAFPGGKVGPPDRELAQPGLSAQAIAAIRELFEETGVLLARRPDGSFPPTTEEFAHLRGELLADRLSFRDLLAGLQLQLCPEDLTPVGALRTPEFSPVRFDTAFFVAELPPGQQADVWPGELETGTWLSADACLQAWTRGEMRVSPPTVSLLEAVRGRPVEDLPQRVRPLLEALEAGAIPPIWFSPAVRMIPLFSQGLPPSTHTNAYLVGTGPRYLIDPGPSDPAEQARLFEVLEEEVRERGRLTAIVLTHHHPDHIGAVSACAQRYGLPIFAHPVTNRLLAGKLTIDQELNEGDQLDLGPAPHGDGSWHLEAIFTPGHAPGHLAFYESSYGLLFVGDMVSTLSSVVIGPPEGDLALYLSSLRRLQTYPARLLLPAHGGPTARVAYTLTECINHRIQREAELLQALQGGPRRVADLARELYRGLPAKLMRFAEMQIQAGLLKLQQEGKAVTSGQEWQLLTTSQI
jgi:glyoxylase-like metal-dependent hydrolase (beta-lactamase superfamily II)/8-oxo-dGTP pyrophosphatase MutT (NUDIX family)